MARRELSRPHSLATPLKGGTTLPLIIREALRLVLIDGKNFIFPSEGRIP